MKVKVVKTQFSFIKVLITKIIYLMRMMRVSDGDVLLYSNNNRVTFVVFVAALLANRTLCVVTEGNHAYSTIMNNDIGTVLYNGILHFLFSSREMHAVDSIMRIDTFGLFSKNATDFEWLSIRHANVSTYKYYSALRNQSFKDEREALENNFKFINDQQKGGLVLKQGATSINYETSNILEMLEVVNSEFKEEQHLFTDVFDVPFNQAFIYQLYFFLRGDLVNLGGESPYLFSSHRKVKKLLFLTNDLFQAIWHRNWKSKVYSRFNRFLMRWKLTKWITRFTYQAIIGIKSKDEYVIINPDRALDREKFLDQARTKVSIIFGTPADANTLAINRYDDKQLKIASNSFRIMDANKSINIKLDNLNQLYIGGTRIPSNVKTKLAIQSKSKTDKYYFYDVYCELHNDVLTIKANSEDIYYDIEGCRAIDTGTRKRSLMALPYIKQVDVLKIVEDVVVVVDFDKEFIKSEFERPTLLGVLSHLNQEIDELNLLYTESEQIKYTVVSKEFFDEFDRVQGIITKKNFIEYLNQQPSNYLLDHARVAL